jgi:hypothetical protein
MKGQEGTREDLEAQESQNNNLRQESTTEQQSPFISAIDLVTLSDSERFALIFNEVRALRIEIANKKQ